MRTLAATFLITAMATSSFAQSTPGSEAVSSSSPTQTNVDVRAVSPALDRYIREVVLGDLWQRPQLSPRDRSVVTLAVLIARNQTVDLPFHLRLALDNGVKAIEITEKRSRPFARKVAFLVPTFVPTFRRGFRHNGTDAGDQGGI
jgi:4-carboxymuconolactone decarboxylase